MDSSSLRDHNYALRLYLEEWIHEHEKLFEAAARTGHVHVTCNGASPNGAPSGDGSREMKEAVHLSPEAPSLGGTSYFNSNFGFKPSPTGLLDSSKSESEPVSNCANVRGTTTNMVANFGVNIGTLRAVTQGRLVRDDLCQRVFHAIESHWCFTTSISTVILLNAIYLAYATEYTIGHIVEGRPRWFQVAEVAFCVTYFVEIIVKVGAQRLRFVFGSERGWNIFDTLLVLTAANEQASGLLPVGVNMSYLRVLRLVKMVKLLRVIRLLRAFRELRLVLDSLLGSVKSMLWSVVLVCCVGFMFGICFVQGAAELLERDPTDPHGALDYWGSVGLAMRTLFWASTGGADWQELAEPLIFAGPHYYAIFCFYIAFFLLVLMNSLTSLFVDATMQYSQRDQDALMQEQLAQKQQYVYQAGRLFEKMCPDENGDVTFDNFVQHMQDPHLVAFAGSLDIEPVDLEQFFSILSRGGKQPVDLEQFVMGCIKARGGAKSLDIMDVIMSQQNLSEDVHAVKKDVTKTLANIRGKLHAEMEQVRTALHHMAPKIHALHERHVVSTVPGSLAGSSQNLYLTGLSRGSFANGPSVADSLVSADTPPSPRPAASLPPALSDLAELTSPFAL